MIHRFRNHYKCPRCAHEWADDWDSTCDDDCPNCGMRHISPHESEDIDVIPFDDDAEIHLLHDCVLDAVDVMEATEKELGVVSPERGAMMALLRKTRNLREAAIRNGKGRTWQATDP